MTAAMAMPGSTASTLPIHHFAGGPEGDGRFVVERIRAPVCDDIPPVQPRGPTANGRGKTTRIVGSRKKAETMRQGRTEFTFCTGLRTRGGKQAWGSLSTDLLRGHEQKG